MSVVTEPLTFTTEEAAKRIGVSYDWLKKQVAAGNVRHTRFGRKVSFTDEQIGEIIRSHERPIGTTTSEELPSAAPRRRRRAAVRH